jgi:predicted lipid carrier protein YhbT
MRRVQAALGRWFARRVRAAGRERLERWLRGPRRRRALLWALFTAMPRAVRRRALERERLVIEWRVATAGEARHEVRQLVIENSSAVVVQGEPREPDVSLTVGAADLLLLATGNASGPTLFVQGRLQIDGDPWLAMRLPRLFRSGG